MKKLLPLVVVFGFMVNNVSAMNQPQRKFSCTICDSIELDDFWQQVKNGRISKDEAKEALKYRELKLWHKHDTQSDWVGFDSKIDLLFKQALCSGIEPFTRIETRRGYDITAYALEKNNESLTECCLQQGHSPNDTVLHNNENIPTLAIASSSFWPLLKKYGANFKAVVTNEIDDTLLSDSNNLLNSKNMQWLLLNTDIDINQPNGYGDTAGHTLAHFCSIIDQKKSEIIFNKLRRHGINPFQRNNDNKTSKELAKDMQALCEKQLQSTTDPYDKSLILRDTSRVEKMVLLWDEYEKEYNKRYHSEECYCRSSAHFNKNDSATQSQNITLQQARNAYQLFSSDSATGYFCKKNPIDEDCTAIAKQFVTVNNAGQAIYRRKNIDSQSLSLREEKDEIVQKLISLRNLLTQKMPTEIAKSESDTKSRLSMKQRVAIMKETEKSLGITDLRAQLESIDKQLEQSSEEWKKASKEEQDKRKEAYGYYSASDLDHCSNPSRYHQAIKNLLKKALGNKSQEEKDAESLKINQALHDAYHKGIDTGNL